MIKRDGNHKSLWQSSVDPYITNKTPPTNTIFDVVIVGGGITGVSTALLLQKAGKNCLLLEAQNLCFGTTGGTTAHLNTLLDTPYTTIQKNFSKEIAGKVADATAAAISLIRSNIKEYNIDCGFEEATAYLIALDEKQEKELEDVVEASAEAGLSVKYADEIPVPVPFVKAARFEGQAKFHPLRYVYGLARAFEEANGVILQGCRVTNLKHEEPLEIQTTLGLFKAKDIIYATHTPPGINLLHLRCAPYRSYAMAVTLTDDNYPKDLSYDMIDPYHYYRTQEVDGQSYLIVGGKDHKTGEEENTEHCFTALEATIRKHYSVKEVVYKWSSQYFEPTDGLPYIGHLPAHPDHVYVAAGYGGNGMTYSSVAALIFRSMLLNEEDPVIDTDLFDPNRLKPIAGFTNFVTHNTGVVKNFLGKWFSSDKVTEMAELASGEGRIVKYENEKIGLYKDEKGALHAVSPVCAHMKCEVKWNSAELSWDCPCHGARYNIDGEVITGPADHSLEKVDIGIAEKI
jgi:glycine/D-amino acid oxidase-like deaminating enzyme/Rieske Fe-S protein